MSNEEKPITSRRERRLAQAGLAATGQEPRLTPAQAEAEARAKAAAQAEAARAHAAGVAAAHAAAEAQARPFGEGTQPSAQPSEPLTDRTAAVRARRALDVPADSVRQGGPERSSQARARDRAAQRKLRELAEKEQAVQGSSSPYPSRRALRERETGKVPRVTPREASSEAPDASESETARGRLAGSGAPQPAVSPAQPQAQPQARFPVPGVDPAPPTAMQGIVPQGLTVTPALGPETGSFRKLSHEQIAAARELLKEQAKNQAAMLEGQRGGDGTDVDPEVLAEQVRMAERAAILNRRAQAKQRLAEESRRETAAPARKAPTPTATDNLAMVTPLEFVNVPGVPHPVMKPPTTTHVPITTGQTDRQQRRPAERRAPAELPEGAPVSARSAHGLTPLDAAQSGARRAERERLILLGIGAVGILALIVAIVIIVLGSS
ncbi:hypothetical protein [Sinomonas sp. R1AF57]|uniref:hypothetical protein n=1 Tax=Sinomonas sp. R1AF57 TaxID=2020377 RepID=UPI000B6077FE|nr:hypothetical protein [Sinomonas sp. R1AF57]ASN52122.1 hypothetical protein CGQ25_08555 [Sinomonas sp. R1AF57]